MAGVSLRLSRRLSTRLLPQSNISSHKIIFRPLTSATPRSFVPPATRPPSLPSSSNTIPDLCLGAGGKAPGFVQQMLFSPPVQEKDTKGLKTCDRQFGSDDGVFRSNKSEYSCVVGREYFS
jgi:hypothetical protein